MKTDSKLQVAVVEHPSDEFVIRTCLEQRDKEIDRLWVRSNFMLLVAGATFAAYATARESPLMSLFVDVAGICSAAAWYAITVGSKWWQQNWERKLDEVTAPLYGPLFVPIAMPIDPDEPYLKFFGIKLHLDRYAVVKVVLVTSFSLGVLWSLNGVYDFVRVLQGSAWRSQEFRVVGAVVLVFFAMFFLGGLSLSKWCRSAPRKNVSPPTKEEWAVQVAIAIESARRREAERALRNGEMLHGAAAPPRRRDAPK